MASGSCPKLLLMAGLILTVGCSDSGRTERVTPTTNREEPPAAVEPARDSVPLSETVPNPSAAPLPEDKPPPSPSVTAPAKKPAPLSFRPDGSGGGSRDAKPVEPPEDIRTVLGKAGYDQKIDWSRSLNRYVRFGSKEAADKHYRGDQFDKI